MESLVNYSSEDEQDDYSYAKVAVRERGSGSTVISGRTALEGNGPHLKRSHERTKSGSFEVESYRRSRDVGNERFKNEDKYKIDRRTDKSRDHKEKRDDRDSKKTTDVRNDDKEYEHIQKYDRKLDDQKRYREPKRDHKRDGNDHYRDDKRYNRCDERKTTYAVNNKDRFKSRNDERKQYDDRFTDSRRSSNEERRGGSFMDDRRKEHNDSRNYNDDRKTDRRNDDRKSHRSYNEDRSHAYRPRRSNSPSHLHHSKTNNKYSERREENTKRERKRHSRSRSRSRSHSPDKVVESNLTLISSSQQKAEQSERLGEPKRPETDVQTIEKKNLPTARNFEALLSLPLSENAPKHLNIVTVPATSATTGSNPTTATVQLPSYYNPNVINPNKYVEQMQKRKLIWGAKKSEDSASKWGHAQFSQDQDGKVASKFMRLMGIKTGTGTAADSSAATNETEKKPSLSNTPPNNIDVKSREVMFSTMEHQYEVARQVTHTMRGVGLGFSSQSKPY